MTLYGVDVSSWKPIKDINAVKAAGNDFLITKCTGGLTYKNPLYADQIAKARGAGLLVGHYHYLHETDMDTNADTLPLAQQAKYLTPQRMVAEADYFLANVDIRPGEIVALDVEDKRITGNLSPCVLMWCGYVAGKLGFNPFIYTYPYYIQERALTDPRLTAYPLWYAEYNEPMVNSPAPWPHITLRQYTANATVPGIGADVDRNSFAGTADDWRKLGMPDPQQPQTPNISPIVTEGRNWGAGSKGRIVHHAETVVVINDEDYDPPKTFVSYAVDGQQSPFVELK
jgi:lysozyme